MVSSSGDLRAHLREADFARARADGKWAFSNGVVTTANGRRGRLALSAALGGRKAAAANVPPAPALPHLFTPTRADMFPAIAIGPPKGPPPHPKPVNPIRVCAVSGFFRCLIRNAPLTTSTRVEIRVRI
ncbi:unnamed protein product, partial [Iphiclides podalirius]